MALPLENDSDSHVADRSGPGDPHLFEFLRGSINVLIVDDEKAIINVARQVFECLHLYTLTTCSSSREAIRHFESGKRFHVCVMDMGLHDGCHDQFHLLRAFGAKTSFVVFTGTDNPQYGFECRTIGAKALVPKKGGTVWKELIELVNRYSLVNMIYPPYLEGSGDRISKLLDILLETRPTTVCDWARDGAIEERALRKAFNESLGLSPKNVVELIQLYFLAFEYCCRPFFAPPTNFSKPTWKFDFDAYEKSAAYYHEHRAALDTIICGPASSRR